MSEISYVDALDTFGRWERQNEKLAVLGSNSGFVISLRGAQVTLCLDDMLQLTFSEDGTFALLSPGRSFFSGRSQRFSGGVRWLVCGI